MVLEDISQSNSDVCYVNITQLTGGIPLTTADEASGNVPQKMSEFELFALEFTTMAIESSCSSTTDVSMDKDLQKESEFDKVEPEALEDVSQSGSDVSYDNVT